MAEGSGTSASVESETEPTSDEPTPGPSLLATLRCPQPAAIARKRKVTVNPGPPRGKRRSAGRGNFDPKSITPAQRVREVPDEQLCVSAGKFFCQACREELSTKLSILKGHIKTKKHADGVKRREAKEIRRAAAERVFSLLANCFGDQQNNALQDYVETSIMLQYNKH